MRIVAFTALAVVLAACVGDGPTQTLLKEAPARPNHNTGGATVSVLAPTTFTRGRGTPRTDAVSFGAQGGVVTTLHLSSTDTQGLNATVSLNGAVIFTSLDGAGLPIDLEVGAQSAYTISLRLTGRPGSNIVVSATVPAPAVRNVLFTSDRETPGTHQIYAMNDDGSNVARLTFSGASDFEPRWSPDGTRIAFASDRFGVRDIFIMDADGDNVVRCTASSALNSGPEWSPDGERIAFYSNRGGFHQIYLMNKDCSNQQRISNLTSIDYNPTWSPDGARLAFTVIGGAGQDIWLMNAADGSNRVPLTSNAGINYNPQWSPSGTHIAFTSDRAGGQNVWEMTSLGGSPTQLTFSATSYVPVYSSDGSRILFASNRSGVYQVYDLTRASMAIRQLTNASVGESYGPEIR